MLEKAELRETGIPPEVLRQQDALLDDCVSTWGLDSPVTKGCAALITGHRSLCSRKSVYLTDTCRKGVPR